MWVQLSHEIHTWMAATAPGRGATCRGSSGGVTMLFSPQHQTVPSARGKISGSETLPAVFCISRLLTMQIHRADQRSISSGRCRLRINAVMQQKNDIV